MPAVATIMTQAGATPETTCAPALTLADLSTCVAELAGTVFQANHPRYQESFRRIRQEDSAHRENCRNHPEIFSVDQEKARPVKLDCSTSRENSVGSRDGRSAGRVDGSGRRKRRFMHQAKAAASGVPFAASRAASSIAGMSQPTRPVPTARYPRTGPIYKELRLMHQAARPPRQAPCRVGRRRRLLSVAMGLPR
jgi:hypothetical protein